MTTPRPRDRLDGLDGLRSVAAIYIFACHVANARYWEGWPEWYKGFRAAGGVWMATFFIMSGFVLTYTYFDGRAFRGSARKFYVSRLSRVYPLHLAILLAFVVGSWLVLGSLSGRSLASAGLQSTLLHGWIPPLQFEWNVPTWSLSVEVFVYAVFPFAVTRVGGTSDRRALLRRIGGLWLLGSIAPVAYLVLHPAAFIDPFSVDERNPWVSFVRWFPLFRLPEALIGVCLCRLYVLERAEPVRRSGAWMSLLAVAILGGLVIFGDDVPFLLYDSAFVAPVAALLIMGVARGGGPVHTVLTGRLLVSTAPASLAFYVAHMPLITLAVTLDVLDRPWSMAAFIGAVFAVSYLAHRIIELPARAFILRRFTQR